MIATLVNMIFDFMQLLIRSKSLRRCKSDLLLTGKYFGLFSIFGIENNYVEYELE